MSSDSFSSLGPCMSPPGPTIASGFPLPLGPSRDINETMICPRTGSMSSADDLHKSNR